MNNRTDFLKQMQPENSNKNFTDQILQVQSVTSDVFGVFFKVDINAHRFTHISSSCSGLLGFPPAYFLSGGLRSFFQLWASSDLSFYFNKIFPNECKFLTSCPQMPGCSLLFTLNFRCRNRNGKYMSLLLKTVYVFSHQLKKPQEAFCWLTDISHFKNDEAITHVVEKLDEGGELNPESIFKETYYPKTEASHLSKREQEIYCQIVEGSSTKEIAKKLSLSIFTINNHRKSILGKIKCKNAGELIKNALQHPVDSPLNEIKLPFYKSKRIFIDLSNYWILFLAALEQQQYIQLYV